MPWLAAKRTRAGKTITTRAGVAELADASDSKSTSNAENKALTTEGERQAQHSGDVMALAERLAKLSPEARAALADLLKL